MIQLVYVLSLLLAAIAPTPTASSDTSNPAAQMGFDFDASPYPFSSPDGREIESGSFTDPLWLWSVQWDTEQWRAVQGLPGFASFNMESIDEPEASVSFTTQTNLRPRNFTPYSDSNTCVEEAGLPGSGADAIATGANGDEIRGELDSASWILGYSEAFVTNDQPLYYVFVACSVIVSDVAHVLMHGTISPDSFETNLDKLLAVVSNFESDPRAADPVRQAQIELSLPALNAWSLLATDSRTYTYNACTDGSIREDLLKELATGTPAEELFDEMASIPLTGTNLAGEESEWPSYAEQRVRYDRLVQELTADLGGSLPDWVPEQAPSLHDVMMLWGFPACKS